MDVTTEAFLFLSNSKNKIKEPDKQTLEIEFGEHDVEKRGWHWAITSFAFEAWNKTKYE
jgi:hypothetical protein